ncbi:MAG TPA: ubiquitin-like domain-containing protein, partial [Armatimonadota bacterium]
MRSVLLITVALTLGTTLTLIAQDPPAAKTVTLRVDGTQRQVVTVKPTVQTVLHQEHLNLNTNDRCEPPISTTVTDGMTITITRVTCELLVRAIEIPAPTVTRWDVRFSNEPSILRQGRPGKALETTVMWKKDGVVSTQWISSTRVVRQPRPTVLVRGRMASRSGMSVRRVFTMVATAYDPGPLSCGPRANGRTATGLRATRGIIAVDPRVIPLGT